MSDVLARWNFLPQAAAVNEILPCCGSRAWAHRMAERRPLRDEATLLVASDDVWASLAESDWLDAFRSHPRIGESQAESRSRKSGAPAVATPRSAAWSQQEQCGVADADSSATTALAEGNREYERRFKRTFIMCATGKSSTEVLQVLRRRLLNDEAAELREAVEEQRKITQIRLRKWLREQE